MYPPSKLVTLNHSNAIRHSGPVREAFTHDWHVPSSPFFEQISQQTARAGKKHQTTNRIITRPARNALTIAKKTEPSKLKK
jgi:hypothetical protein